VLGSFLSCFAVDLLICGIRDDGGLAERFARQDGKGREGMERKGKERKGKERKEKEKWMYQQKLQVVIESLIKL